MVLTEVRNELKRSKTILKRPKMTYNLLKQPNIINIKAEKLKVFVLGFRTQVGTRFRTRDADLKTKS